MVANVPAGTKIVVEPVVPDQWAQDIGNPSPLTTNGNRWNKYPLSRRRSTRRPASRCPARPAIVNIEDFETRAAPELVDVFEQQEYCWVVVGSTQRGRAEAEPEAVPQRAGLLRASSSARSTVAYEVSPYSKGKGPVAFNFDWTFNYYPLAYNRPGPDDDDLPPAGRRLRRRASLTERVADGPMLGACPR